MIRLLRRGLHRHRHPQRHAILDELLATQRLDATALRALSLQRFDAIARFAADNTDFYAARFAGLLAPGTPVDPSRLPVLHKADVMQHRGQMLARGVDRDSVREGHTGGSTGRPLTFFYDEAKHERMLAGMMRGFMMSGWRPGERVLYLWGASRDVRRGGVLGGDGGGWLGSELSVAAVEYSAAQMQAWLRLIGRWRPVLLYGYASALAELARHLLQRGMAPPVPLRGVYSTAEMLDEAQREIIERAFGCKCFNQYGCREVPNIAWECRAGGMHVFSDLVHLEVLDGERLLVTSLSDRVMPFIRYELGDSGRLLHGDCSCGSPFPLMATGTCRRNDLISLRDGRRIHPGYFNRLLDGAGGIAQYQWQQLAVDRMVLRLVADGPLADGLQPALQAKVRADLDPSMAVIVERVAAIDRTAAGKHRFVIGLPAAGA